MSEYAPKLPTSMYERVSAVRIENSETPNMTLIVDVLDEATDAVVIRKHRRITVEYDETDPDHATVYATLSKIAKQKLLDSTESV